MFTVFDAIRIAAFAHEGQFDKGRPDLPYLTHPMRVMSQFDQPDQQMVAVLHDSIEDSDGRVTFGWVLDEGCPFEVVAAVDALTHRDGESNEHYWARVRDNPLALVVKLADIADNMNPDRLALLEPEHRDRLIAKYTRARQALMGA